MDAEAHRELYPFCGIQAWVESGRDVPDCLVIKVSEFVIVVCEFGYRPHGHNNTGEKGECQFGSRVTDNKKAPKLVALCGRYKTQNCDLYDVNIEL
jgi:hypothetical protein